MRGTFVRRAGQVLLVAAVLGGCMDTSIPPPSLDPGAKGGGKPGPIAIRIADSQHRGRPSNLPLDELKRFVEAESAGAITVEIVTNASPDADPPGSDAPVIDKVTSGEFEMAVVPARAWSGAGINSL